jgi:hypothetical protein
MTMTYSILGLTAGAALLLASGCSKPEQPSGEASKVTPPAASDMPKPPEAPTPAMEPAPAVAAAVPDASRAASAAASEAPKAAADAVSQAASAAASEAQKAVESPKAAAEHAQPTVAAATEQAVKAAVSQTNTVAAASSTQVQGLIEKAKGLVTDEKYQDALKVVQQLSSLKLTPEQQTLMDGLKSQIQTALAKATGADAASALGNVLGGKK